MINKRKIGNTSLEVSELGMGTAPIGGRPKAINEALVDNWIPIGIIIPDKPLIIKSIQYFDDITPKEIIESDGFGNVPIGKTKKIFELSILFNVPIYTINRKEIWNPQT